MPGGEPVCVCLAGPNGSGKSTLGRALVGRYSLANWIDPDVIARNIADSQGKPTIDDEVSRQAFLEARQDRVAYASRLENFGFETVFSHGSNIAFLRGLRVLGYTVHLYFVATRWVEINVARVRDRVAKGGHDVPEQRIRDRYVRSLQLLALTVREVDRVIAFDNSRHTAAGGGGGRLVCNVENDDDRQAMLSIAPIPTWTLSHCLVPFAEFWPRGRQYAELMKEFGDQIVVDEELGNLNTFIGRERFLSQFLKIST
jgi:predicted ABC-type ATPase